MVEFEVNVLHNYGLYFHDVLKINKGTWNKGMWLIIKNVSQQQYIMFNVSQQ